VKVKAVPRERDGNVGLVQEMTGPMLVFDGECGFCTACATWAAKGWRLPVRAVPWQGLGAQGLGAVGLTTAQVQEAAWWVDGSGRLFRGHRAIGKALLAGGGRRRLAGTLVLTPPSSWVAAGLYRLVVRHRHHLPGASPACRVEQP
jgi:predicted DCC family thiol-disulfide oxidoreductase YuxK